MSKKNNVIYLDRNKRKYKAVYSEFYSDQKPDKSKIEELPISPESTDKLLDKDFGPTYKSARTGSVTLFPEPIEELLDNDCDRDFLEKSLQYKSNMKNIGNTYEVNWELIVNEQEAIKKEIRKIIDSNKIKIIEHKDYVQYKFPKSLKKDKEKLENIHIKLENLDEKYAVVEESIDVNWKSLYVALFGQFEALIEELFHKYLTQNPGTPPIYDKEFPFETLKDKFTTISEVEDYVFEEKMKKVKFMSYPERLKWMKTHPKFEFDKLDRKIFDQLYTIRKDFVHNNSYDYKKHIINLFKLIEEHFDLNRYLPSLKDREIITSNFVEGKEDSHFDSAINKGAIQSSLFLMCYTFLFSVGLKMLLACWVKLNEKYESNNIRFYNNHIYSILNSDKEPHISAILLDNLIESELESESVDILNTLVLFSQSLKECGDDGYKIICDEINLSSFENFDLIKYGILDDVKSVINIMKNLNKNSSIKFTSAGNWPAKYILRNVHFEGINKDPKFLKAFEETFEETF